MDYGGYTIWCGSHDCEQAERKCFSEDNLSRSSSRDRKNCKTEKQPDEEAYRLEPTPAGFDTGTIPARLF